MTPFKQGDNGNLTFDGQNTHQLIKVTPAVTDQAQISGLTFRRIFVRAAALFRTVASCIWQGA